MKLFTNSISLSVTIAVLFLASCQKSVEVYPEDGEIDNVPKRKANRICQITSIHFNDPFNSYNGRFYYNKVGNPDSVIFDVVGTGFPNLYFKYDNTGRLTETKLVYSDGTYELWHRYGYVGNVITTDTVYAFGEANTEPEPANFMSKRINFIEYDNYGRIFRETEDYIVPDLETVVRTYEYDNGGNLQVPGTTIIYDGNVNLHSLHETWQFLARDYSDNNPLQAGSYNEYALPMLFDLPESESSSFRFLGGSRSLNRSQIEYDCKKAKDIMF